MTQWRVSASVEGGGGGMDGLLTCHSRTTGAQFASTPMRSKTGPTAAADPRVPEALALCALTLAVLWVYCPIDLLRGATLFSSDHFTLHLRRLDFAREQLFGPSHRLPAWYPREFLGTPFWSNLQNFPLIPTRLIPFTQIERDRFFLRGSHG